MMLLLPAAVTIVLLLLLSETTPQSSQQEKCLVGTKTTMLIPYVVVPFEFNVKEDTSLTLDRQERTKRATTSVQQYEEIKKKL